MATGALASSAWIPRVTTYYSNWTLKNENVAAASWDSTHSISFQPNGRPENAAGIAAEESRMTALVPE